MTDSLLSVPAAREASPASREYPRIADHQSLHHVLSDLRPDALALALACASREVALQLIAELSIDEQLRVVQQLVNVRTTVPKTTLEVARLLRQHEPPAGMLPPRARAS